MRAVSSLKVAVRTEAVASNWEKRTSAWDGVATVGGYAKEGLQLSWGWCAACYCDRPNSWQRKPTSLAKPGAHYERVRDSGTSDKQTLPTTDGGPASRRR